MKKLLLPLLIFISLLGKSQKFEYKVLFEGIGDNREYFNPIALPQTIMGSRGAFEVGIETDKHRIRGGLSQLFEFGTNLDAQKPKLTLYYQFNDKKNEFLFGSFPRRGKIDFPLAMLTDTLLYYRPNIEGLFIESRWDWGKQNVFVDWTSRQTDVERENFMVGFSGEIGHKNLFLQNYLLIFHNAGPAIDIPGDHIKDNMGYALQAGIRTNKNTVFMGEIKIGALGSWYRERSVTDGFISANSFFAEAKGRYKKLGIKSVLSSGGSHNFAFGDRFYSAKNYMRTDAIWYFVNHKQVKANFKYSFHLIDWNDLDQQQQLSVIYVFGT